MATDRPGWETLLFGVAEDNVFVAVIIGRLLGELRPFPARKNNQVRVIRRTGKLVADPRCLLDLLPLLLEEPFGVVIEAKEIQAGTEAGKVAGVCWRVGARAALGREAEEEGVEGESRVDVQVTKEDLLYRLSARAC